MFTAEGTVLTAKVETTVDGSREYGRVVLLSYDGRDTAIVTGGADFAREMEAHQGKPMSVPIKLSADRQGGVRTTHDRARAEQAKAAAAKPQGGKA